MSVNEKESYFLKNFIFYLRRNFNVIKIEFLKEAARRIFNKEFHCQVY